MTSVPGRDLLIGRGVTRTQLDAALCTAFGITPDAICAWDQVADWGGITRDGFALISTVECPHRFAFKVGVESVGHRIDWETALAKLAALLGVEVLWPDEDGYDVWCIIQPDGRRSATDIDPILYDAE